MFAYHKVTISRIIGIFLQNWEGFSDCSCGWIEWGLFAAKVVPNNALDCQSLYQIAKVGLGKFKNGGYTDIGYCAPNKKTLRTRAFSFSQVFALLRLEIWCSHGDSNSGYRIENPGS